MIGSLLLGAAVGIVSSILGLGGGILIVPLLPLMTDLSRKESVFVSLCAIFVIVSVNTYAYLKDGKVNKKAVMMFGPLTAVGSVVAVLFISPHLSNGQIKNILAAVLLLWGLFNLFKILNTKENKKNKDQKKSVYMSLALVAGILSGLLGIGSGLILSLMLVGFDWMKNDEISPTSNGIMIFTTFFAAITYAFKVDMAGAISNLTTYALPISLAAVATAFWGRKVQDKLSRKHRGLILVAMLVALSIKTFLASS